MSQYGFFVDLSRCIGCNSCTIACKQWHDIDPGPTKPMRVFQWETGVYPNIRLHMLPVPCYHCEVPICMEACPNLAIYKDETYGAVLVDPDKCQGTRKCWEACPYGAPQYEGDEPGLKMIKCNMCIDRLKEGLMPICVLSCSMRALEFGLLDELVKKYGNLNRLEAKPGYASCRLACPAEVNAEGYIDLISKGQLKEAIALFRETTPFAGVLGRVCARNCESDCQMGKIDKPVAICSLKRYMADSELRVGRAKATRITGTKEGRIAIIGSGPAGLSCAYDLIRKGYSVTVFEAAPKAGGMLRYGIPEYRLPSRILDNEISYIEDLGVEIKTSAPVKKVDEIFNQGYKTIFVATGASVSQKMGIPGEDARGVIYALEFLKGVNSGETIELGNRVTVVGGGSVAIDTARVALRIGAEQVHLICLESRDLTSKDRMPAQDREIEDAEEEGVVIHPYLGLDRLLTKGGKVVGLVSIVCTSVMDAEGGFAPKFAEGPAPYIETDTVIVAIGQRPDPSHFVELERTNSGGINVNELTLETNIRGVFAGADVVTGTTDVISAVAQGKYAAISINRYLSGLDLESARQLPVKSVVEREEIYSTRAPVIPLRERDSFTEVEQQYDKKTACEEANRCLRCGSTLPSVVFKPSDPQKPVITWDPIRALVLWQKREPYEGEPLPDVFSEITEITNAPEEIVGRNRLMLKTKYSQDLLYYTTDNE